MTWCFRWACQSTTDQAWACPLESVSTRLGHPRETRSQCRSWAKFLSTCSADRAQERCREGDSRHAHLVSQELVASCLLSLSFLHQESAWSRGVKTHLPSTKLTREQALFPHVQACLILPSHHFYPKPSCHQALVPSNMMSRDPPWVTPL